MRQKLIVLALAGLVACLGQGCVISHQIGEPIGAAAPLPDQMTFLFDTGFNRTMVMGRLLVPVLIAFLVFSKAGTKGKGQALLIAAPLVIGGAIWFSKGWDTVKHYRIQVNRDSMHVEIPPASPRDIAYADVDSMRADYEMHDTSLGSTGPKTYAASLHHLKEYQSIAINLKDGTTVNIDASRLSVEQRGTLLRAIQERSGLHEGPS